LTLHQEARSALAGASSEITGELILAASSVPGEHLLPRLLAEFRACFPGIRVKATVQDSQAVLELLEQGRAHLGLVGRKSDIPHLNFRSIGCDELVLVVAPGTKWTRGRSLNLAQLERIPLILREIGSGSRWCLEQALAREGLRLADLAVVLELGSNEAIKEAVTQGLGGAVLSSRVVKKEIKARRLKALAVTGLCLERKIYLAWDQRRVLPSAAQHFLRFLEEAADVPLKT
jgi:DNA-binding transcriptional LysR family regulator